MSSELSTEAFTEQLQVKTRRCEEIILSYLPVEDGYAKAVIDAMNYSVRAGGKRLRPLILSETAHMYGAHEEVIEPFMAAIEMIHTYSLVHDDLPAMDNDEYRRGQKTTWSVYGEAMAILAGDGLLNYAYETALRAFDAAGSEEEKNRIIKALRILMRNAGIYGMVGGQCADIVADTSASFVDQDYLLFIHKKKTAAMIESAFLIGATLFGAPQEDLTAFGTIAQDIGLAFQIQDDILDVTGEKTELGKSIGKDEKEGKVTYVSLHGLEESHREVRKLTEHALTLMDEISESSEFLNSLIRYLMTRTK